MPDGHRLPPGHGLRVELPPEVCARIKPGYRVDVSDGAYEVVGVGADHIVIKAATRRSRRRWLLAALKGGR